MRSPSFSWWRRFLTSDHVSALLLMAVVLSLPATASAGIGIRDGYFWDGDNNAHFLPHGFAYQTWNPPVFANQTLKEIDQDLEAMRGAGANSLRVELVWGEFERQEGVHDWARADHLIRRAGELGLKLFVLIGFQYPPPWFVERYPEAMAVSAEGKRLPILNYNHPQAREAYTRYVSAVCARYRTAPAIAAWILGNEFAFFDLWEPVGQKTFAGYDRTYSLPSWQKHLEKTFKGNIKELNTAWGTDHTGFAAVPMPPACPPCPIDDAATRRSGCQDAILWRQQVVGDFIAAGARAAKTAAPGQLITYSLVGGIYSGIDSNHTGEDVPTIAARCRLAGSPLDFISVNNYAWGLSGHELRSVDFGIAKVRDLTGLPVLVSETGHTSTETNFPGAGERQAAALVGAVWESLLSGAIGVHLFHWSDRDGFLGGGAAREAGFGVVRQDRTPKPGVYEAVRNTFRQLQGLSLAGWLPQSKALPPDVLVFLPEDIALGFHRANEETAALWGGLRRLGMVPHLVDNAGFDRILRKGVPQGVQALLFPRNFQMRPEQLAALEKNFLGKGVNIHANGDLPGQWDSRHRPNPKWRQTMAKVFGLEVENAQVAFEGGLTPGPNWDANYAPLTLSIAPESGMTATLSGFAGAIRSWKFWRGLATLPGAKVQARYTSPHVGEAQPALITQTHDRAKAVVTAFAVGDCNLPQGSAPSATFGWDFRGAWLTAIYRDFFGIAPRLTVSGQGAAYVYADVRTLPEGALIGLMNGHNQEALVQVAAPGILQGRSVKSLTEDRLITAAAGPTLANLRLPPDGYLLLHVARPNPVDLLNKQVR